MWVDHITHIAMKSFNLISEDQVVGGCENTKEIERRDCSKKIYANNFTTRCAQPRLIHNSQFARSRVRANATGKENERRSRDLFFPVSADDRARNIEETLAHLRR